LRGQRDSMRAREVGAVRIYNVKLDWWSAHITEVELNHAPRM
jgi:hypothetical protein